MIIIIINMLLLLIRAQTLAAIEMSADVSCYRGRKIVVGLATTYGLDALGSKFLRTHPHRPRSTLCHLHKVHRVFFPAAKRLGRGVPHPTTSSVEVEYG